MFVLFLTAPSVILVIDKNADVSIFYNTAAPEEEEKQGVSKDTEVVYYKAVNTSPFNETGIAENNLEYFFKKYQKPHLNLISPPPEHLIL